jgi:hypothetical protein
MGNGLLGSISAFLEDLSRIVMRISVLAVNLAKLAVMGVVLYLFLRFGVGLFDFMAALFRTLPQWPR